MKLPLYTQSNAWPPVTSGDRSGCQACELHTHAKMVGVAADGDPGGLLVLGEEPTPDDLKRGGRPFSNTVGLKLRKALETFWEGPIAYDYAIRCNTRAKVTPAKIRTCVFGCKPFTVDILDAVQPTRIFVTGPKALQSLTDRCETYPHVKRGYQWITYGGRDIPVFFLPSIAGTFSNVLRKRKWMEDVRWAMAAAPDKHPQDAETTIVDTLDVGREIVGLAEESGCVVVDIETYGDPYESDFWIMCVSMGCLGSDETYTWDTRDPESPMIAPLVEILTNPGIAKLGANFKYDVVGLEIYLKIVMQGRLLCTKLVHKLLDVTESAALDACANHVGLGGHKGEAHEYRKESRALISKGRTRTRAKLRKSGLDSDSQSYDTWYEAATDLGMDPLLAHAVAKHDQKVDRYSYAFIPWEPLLRYCARDVLVTNRLWRWMWPQLQSLPDLKAVWDELVEPSTRTVANLERAGLPVDLQELQSFAEFLRLKEVNVMLRLTGDETIRTKFPSFNVNSTDQLQELLFKHLGLNPIKFSKKTVKPSVDAETLEALKGHHDIVPTILEYRQLKKLQSVYGEGLLKHVKSDGRIHPTFNITGTETGRMSCTEPNCQTIPSKGEYAKLAKSVFAVQHGRRLVQLDYSQLELRIAAYVSGDPEMLKIYAEGRDYHSETAKTIAPTAWGVEFFEPTEDMQANDPSLWQTMYDIRRAGKVVNFGLAYGMGDATLAKSARVTVAQATAMRASILGKFVVFDKWRQRCVRDAKTRGYANTLWNGKPARRRPLLEVANTGRSDYDRALRANAENGSFNSPVQGTASDYCLASLNAIDRWLSDEGYDARIVMTVHDSIIIDTAESYLHDVIDGARDIMVSWESGPVDLVADCEVGRSWGSLTALAEHA